MNTRPPDVALKPCPFCGSEAEMDTQRGYSQYPSGRPGSSVAIYCLQCSADMCLCREDMDDHTTDDLVVILTEAWNSRALLSREPPAALNDDRLFSLMSAEIKEWEETENLRLDHNIMWRLRGRLLAALMSTLSASEPDPRLTTALQELVRARTALDKANHTETDKGIRRAQNRMALAWANADKILSLPPEPTGE